MSSSVAVTAYGAVEYCFEGDEGPVVVGLHGSPGSYLQMNAFLDRLNLTGRNCRRLTFSRPGYGKTPLASGSGLTGQSMLLAALLDRFNLSEPVVLVGFSGGGLPTLEFARLYPKRVRKILLISPVTGEYAMFGRSFRERLFNRILYSGFVMQLAVFLTGHAPRLVLHILLKAMSCLRGDALVNELDRLENCPEDREFLLDLFRHSIPFQHMQPGIRNDNRNTLTAHVSDFRDIPHPILLFHGECDADVSIRQSEQLCQLLPDNTELIRIYGGGHLLLVHPQLEQLKQHALLFCTAGTRESASDKFLKCK